MKFLKLGVIWGLFVEFNKIFIAAYLLLFAFFSYFKAKEI